MAKKISTYTQIRSLKAGETLTFPIDRMLSIRTAVVNINTLNSAKEFSTKINREARTISVTRK